MRLFALALLVVCFTRPVRAESCSTTAVAPLLEKLFSTLGQDCPTYAALFSQDAKYYHQHDGYKNAAELLKNCQTYATFCPGNDCKFRQNGAAMVAARGNDCHLLVPYLWSEIPANKGNLEPHTGWEYIVATADNELGVGYRMKYFAELETSYSVAFNWAKPDDTPAMVAESTLKLLLLPNSAAKGECNNPIAPVLTKYFNDKSGNGNLWRQQGDAVVLAAGGLCHVTVPYSSQVGTKLKTGHFVFILQPDANKTYVINDAIAF